MFLLNVKNISKYKISGFRVFKLSSAGVMFHNYVTASENTFIWIDCEDPGPRLQELHFSCVGGIFIAEGHKGPNPATRPARPSCGPSRPRNKKRPIPGWVGNSWMDRDGPGRAILICSRPVDD